MQVAVDFVLELRGMQDEIRENGNSYPDFDIPYAILPYGQAP